VSDSDALALAELEGKAAASSNNRYGYGNPLFVDGHVGEFHTPDNKPEFQNGPDWNLSFNQ
jgi:prepilin-type processing-associated H-X9-DG protein